MTTSALYLSSILATAAQVELFNDAEGVFGELIHPALVVNTLEQKKNEVNLVGNVSQNAAHPVPTTNLTSQSFKGTNDFGIEFDNTTNDSIRVRWINAEGNNPHTHVWTIPPHSNMVQYTRPGHLFVLSTIPTSTVPLDLFGEAQELVLGAYRPLLQMTSGTSHCIMIEQKSTGLFCMEVLLLNEKDALVVGASALDPVTNKNSKQTIQLLNTIVNNVMSHPDQAKYRKLRVGNPKIQRSICSSWGAMYFLNAVGFHETKQEENGETEEFLILESTDNEQLFDFAKELLTTLKSRAQAHFVKELAPPTPWQQPVVVSTTASQNSRWNTEGTRFISGDEYWARAERNSRRRARGGRRPAPGEAPSSRGNWGR